MNAEQSDKNLVNRYLNEELSGIELESFRERMLNDVHFKNEVRFQSLLRSGILLSKEEDLKKKILGKIKYRKARIPFSLKLIFTFLIVTGVGITLWFYVGTDSSEHPTRYSFFPFSSKEKDKKADSKTVDEKSKPEDSRSGTDQRRPSATGDELTRNENTSEGSGGIKQGEQNQTSALDSVSQAINNDNDIVIKKEQLLISISIPVIEKPAANSKAVEASQNSSLTHDAVEKLNPSAGVPDEEKATSGYLVEFWISPINYHGYKMSKNKLIIYGIEEPDAVKLYRLNDVLFMKYGNEFFRLFNTFEYIPYQRMKETDVPLAIRQ